MASGNYTRLLAIPVVIAGIFGAATVAHTQAPTPQAEKAAAGAMLTQYCSGCHSPALKTAGIVLNSAGGAAASTTGCSSKLTRMPPSSPRPANATVTS